MQSSDKKLIIGYLQGNNKEFFTITNWITTVVKNEYWGLEEYWADIIQDVRLKLYLNLKQNRFRLESSLKTYVYRITKYTCIDHLRKKNRRGKIREDADKLEDHSDYFQDLIYKEEKEILYQIFYRLADKCRTLLKMVFLQKLSYKKTSSLLGIAEGTVKSRVFRCLEKARQLRKEFVG